MFGLQLPLTLEPHTTFSNPCNKVRGTYIYKEAFLRLSLLLCRYDAVDDDIIIAHIFRFVCVNTIEKNCGYLE